MMPNMLSRHFKAIFAAALIGVVYGPVAAAEPMIDRNLLDEDVTPLARRSCPQPVGNVRSDPYRLLIEIGDGGDGEWEVTIETGRLAAPDIGIEDGRKAAFRLTLNYASAKPGMRFLTPTLNLRRGGDDGYCVTISDRGAPPRLIVRNVIRTNLRAGALSVGSDRASAPLNLIAAAKIWSECETGDCAGEFDFDDPARFNDQELPQKSGSLWSVDQQIDETGLPLDDRRNLRLARLKRAFSSVVYLEALEYRWGYSAENGRHQYSACGRNTCASRCTGFLIAPNVIMTNAHCLFGETDRGEKKAQVKTLFGWLRPVQGGPKERHRAPNFQHLTPVFFGSWGGADFALLQIESDDRSPDRGAGTSEREFLPLSKSGRRPADGALLSTTGYPARRDSTLDELVVNFDDYCRVTTKRNSTESGTVVSYDGTMNFRHLCDTEGGASGSPIFDRGLTEVVAVHFGGYLFDESAGKFSMCGEEFNADGSIEKEGEFSICHNTAMPICAIRDFLDVERGRLEAGAWQPPFVKMPPPGVWPYSYRVPDPSSEDGALTDIATEDEIRMLYFAKARQLLAALDEIAFNRAETIDRSCKNERIRATSRQSPGQTSRRE